jgi:ATP-dependent Lon protease
MSDESIIPLFPLGVVLMPNHILPLHIFEQRYREMVAWCLENEEVFGIVYYDGSQTKEVGCTARIIEVLKRYEDGRMDILTQGERRFRIETILQEKDYLEAEVSYFDDTEQETDESLEELVHRGVEIFKEVSNLSGYERDFDFLERLGLEDLTFILASSEGFLPMEKQALLEMTSMGERLRKSVEALDRIHARMKMTQEISRIVGGNGHLPDFFNRRKPQ